MSNHAPIMQDGNGYIVYMATDGYRCAVIDLASASLSKSFVVDPVCDLAPPPNWLQAQGPMSSSWVCTPYFTNGSLFCLTNHGLADASLEGPNTCELDYTTLDNVTWHLWEVNPGAGTSRHCASGSGAAKTPITFAPDGSLYFGTFCTQGSFYQYDRERNLNAFTPDPPDRFNHEGQR
ncbi:MAG: hypothetical protein LBJ99_01495 [Oscillospiraceae bacterium]|nr:hypothetical protein [Oscillospiraceae bacterium]